MLILHLLLIIYIFTVCVGSVKFMIYHFDKCGGDSIIITEHEHDTGAGRSGMKQNVNGGRKWRMWHWSACVYNSRNPLLSIYVQTKKVRQRSAVMYSNSLAHRTHPVWSR